MKITFLTTLLAMLFTLPAFGFSLGDLLNPTGKSDEPRQATGPDSAATSAGSGAAVSESAHMGGQQGIPNVDSFLKGISGQTQTNPGESGARNPDSPSNVETTGNNCGKNDQGEFVCQ